MKPLGANNQARCCLEDFLACVYQDVGLYCHIFFFKGSLSLSLFLRNGGASSSSGSSKASKKGDGRANHNARWSLWALLTCAGLCCLVWLKNWHLFSSCSFSLESNYEYLHMRVIHAHGRKSANIPLHRSLRKECPLSPISRGVVVIAMLRWLDFKEGGDVVTNTLCFADDFTLITTNVHKMNILLACLNSYCQMGRCEN